MICCQLLLYLFGISLQKTKYYSDTDILRETQISQYYRYAKISQQFEGPKNLLLVGAIAGFINLKKHSKHNKFASPVTCWQQTSANRTAVDNQVHWLVQHFYASTNTRGPCTWTPTIGSNLSSRRQSARKLF